MSVSSSSRDGFVCAARTSSSRIHHIFTVTAGAALRSVTGSVQVQCFEQRWEDFYRNILKSTFSFELLPAFIDLDDPVSGGRLYEGGVPHSTRMSVGLCRAGQKRLGA